MVAASGCAPPMPQARGQNPFPGEVAAEVLATHLNEGLVRALNDALAADIDPGAGRHLPEHHQALAVELVEMLPVGPLPHQVRIRNNHARSHLMRRKHCHRLPGLHQQRILGPKSLKFAHDSVKAFPIPRSPSDPSVNHKV